MSNREELEGMNSGQGIATSHGDSSKLGSFLEWILGPLFFQGNLEYVDVTYDRNDQMNWYRATVKYNFYVINMFRPTLFSYMAMLV